MDELFNGSTEIMSLFYRCFIESILSYCIIGWFGNLKMSNENRLGSLVKTVTKISRRSQTNLSDINNWRVVKSANPTLNCPNHPLHWEFELLPSGCRFRAPVCKTKRFHVSIPSAIDMRSNQGWLFLAIWTSWTALCIFGMNLCKQHELFWSYFVWSSILWH